MANILQQAIEEKSSPSSLLMHLNSKASEGVPFQIILEETLVVTSFVLLVMLLVEYFSTMGWFQPARAGQKSGMTQIVLCAALGLIPGCFGTFAVVTLFIHSRISLGAMLACAITTSGDEGFVMLAVEPFVFAYLHLILFFAAGLCGLAVDAFMPMNRAELFCDDMHNHPQERVRSLALSNLVANLKTLHPLRAILLLSVSAFFLFLLRGQLGHWHDSIVLSVGLFLLALAILGVLLEAPMHFLRVHFLKHIVIKHGPRMAFWTFLSFTVLALLHSSAELETLLQSHHLLLMISAGVLGLLPESGPHLIFFSFYISSKLPFLILFVSSFVQDGHGLLPLLSEMPREFLRIKIISLGLGVCIGLVWYVAFEFIQEWVLLWA